jgi:Rrf2 family protein
VRSQRGAKGGYVLAREPWKINLLEVMTCLEGADSEPKDPDAPPKTLEHTVIYEVWTEVNLAAKAVLRQCTLQDLCEKRDARRQLDIMYYI